MPNLNTTTNRGLTELVSVDLSTWGLPVYRFVNSGDYEASELGTVTWGGYEWTPLPFQSVGWKRGERSDKPTITVPDFGSEIYTTLKGLNGAPGAPVFRYQALAEDILANNPGASFSTDRYLLNKYTAKIGVSVTLELANHTEFARTEAPSFTMTRKHYPGLGSALLR